MEKKNFLFVSLTGLISDIAWQVSKEGHEVRYYIGDKKERDKEKARKDAERAKALKAKEKERELKVIESEAYRKTQEIMGRGDAEAVSIYAAANSWTYGGTVQRSRDDGRPWCPRPSRRPTSRSICAATASDTCAATTIGMSVAAST